MAKLAPSTVTVMALALPVAAYAGCGGASDYSVAASPGGKG